MFTTNRPTLTHMMRARPLIVATACLVVGVFAGSAGVLLAQNRTRVEFFNSGLFTLSRGEGARLSLSLDDNHNAPPARIALSFIDRAGSVLLFDEVTVQPGASTALQFEEPGAVRAHARVIEPNVLTSNRREVAATVEIYDVDTLIAKDRVCNIIPNVSGTSRIPD